MKTACATLVILSMCLLSGCATMNRHPRLTKITFATAGIVAGGTLGYMQRNHFCSYTYDGQPYYGTTCPAPKGAVKLK
jgi:hypothetical protein